LGGETHSPSGVRMSASVSPESSRQSSPFLGARLTAVTLLQRLAPTKPTTRAASDTEGLRARATLRPAEEAPPMEPTRPPNDSDSPSGVLAPSGAASSSLRRRPAKR